MHDKLCDFHCKVLFTFSGHSLKKGVYDDGSVLIYGGSVQELKGVTLGDNGFIIGGACTVSEFSKCLDDINNSTNGNQYSLKNCIK